MTDKEFWIQVRRGLLMVVAAIEHRWKLPASRGLGITLGAPEQAPQANEPPAEPLAQTRQGE
jgi:hypothetical protein